MVESNEDQASWRVRLAQVRQELRVGQARNIAIAEFQIGGNTGELRAVSGQADRVGTVGLPQLDVEKTRLLVATGVFPRLI